MRLVEKFLIINAIIKEANLREEDLPLNFDEKVFPIFCKHTKLHTQFIPLELHSKIFRGITFKYKSGTKPTKIIYSSELNECWTRFTKCKEMIHVLMADHEDGMETDEHFDNVMKNYVGIKDVESTITTILTHVNEEEHGEYLAIELMIPLHLRHIVYDMKRDGKTDKAIALNFKVPEKIINTILYDVEFNKYQQEIESLNSL